MPQAVVSEPICILPASLQHVPAILNILQQNLITNLDTSASNLVEQRGFLIHAFKPEVLETAITDPEHYLVLTAWQQQRMQGYIWACDYQRLATEFQATLADVLTEHHVPTSHVLYYRQIAKMPGSKGIGSAMLSALCNEAIQRGYQYVICQIMHKPFENKASIKFHENAGFKLLTTLSAEDKISGLYIKAIAPFL